MKKSIITLTAAAVSAFTAGVVASSAVRTARANKNAEQSALIICANPDYEIIMQDNKYYYKAKHDNDYRRVHRVYTAYPCNFPNTPEGHDEMICSCPKNYDISCTVYNDDSDEEYVFWRFDSRN